VSQLREAPAIINIDNVTDIIKSPILAALLTAPAIRDRLLGKSQMLELPVRSVLISTGNNLRVGGDMVRRCYYIKIDANAVHPHMRTGFKYELPQYAIDNRGRIVAGLLTMARAWLCAGRPRGRNPVLGSFESWCRVVGGILEYSGVNGFLGNLEEMRQNTADEDDDALQWTAWMATMYARFGNEDFTVSELDAATNELNWKALRDTAPFSLGDFWLLNEKARLTVLGTALHSHKGRLFALDDNSVIKLNQSVDRHKKKKIYNFLLL
jgi:hypothetical protein